MRVTRTDTTDRWITAARSLSTEQIEACIRALSKCARHADDEGDLLPSVMLAVAAGQPPYLAARVACQSAERDRSRTPVPPVIGEGWEQGERVPTSPSAESVALGEDTPSVDYLTLGEVLPSLPVGSQTILRGVAVAGLTKRGAYAALARGERVPLRVSAVAQAIGQPTPRKSEQSALLRAAACRAWAQASVAMGYATDERERAERALAYVTQPPRRPQSRMSHPVNVGSVWVKGEPNGIPFTPSQDGRAVRSLSYRPVAPVKHAPNPRPTDGVWEGVPYGMGSVGLPDREQLPVILARRAAREQVRQDSGRESRERADRSPVDRPGRYGSVVGSLGSDSLLCRRPVATVSASPAAERFATCGCGARPRGTVLLAGEHPLTPCEAPNVDRCGCKSKRGALLSQSGIPCHAPRSGK